MEKMVNSTAFDWSGCSVFLTGHTGFKGSWLSLMLHRLNARTHGYAFDPPTEPSLFESAAISGTLTTDFRGDVTNKQELEKAMLDVRPEIVFHLAAQPLVRTSYKDPTGTFATNVLGTANLLDAVRKCESVRAVVIITTDKVYQNHGSDTPYTETDPLGGTDPYSASKAAAEIITASMRSSFFNGASGHPARIATARAGNVIGGGDWAHDRLLSDCLRSFASGEPVRLRYPDAVRPWQHVLDPLTGYLKLAEALCGKNGLDFARAWNFGPGIHANATVRHVANTLAKLWSSDAKVIMDPNTDHPHEAKLLALNTEAAQSQLNWTAKWNLQTALGQTVDWHKAWIRNAETREFTLRQIESHSSFQRYEFAV